VDILAVGDFTITLSGDNAVLAFQPAGSNVFYISSVFSGSSFKYSLTDGTDLSQQGQSVDNGQPRGFFIDNSVYLRIPNQGAGDHSAFSSLQIK
tara:strand:- start:47 stop:328 length:282 start_codon:yes stop_codon:yes gene_type:complete